MVNFRKPVRDYFRAANAPVMGAQWLSTIEVGNMMQRMTGVMYDYAKLRNELDALGAHTQRFGTLKKYLLTTR